MNESTLALVVFAVITIASAMISHVKIKSYWRATILATLVSVVLFQVIAYINLGYLDPFILIAIVITGVVALLISMLIGALVNTYRNKINGV